MTFSRTERILQGEKLSYATHKHTHTHTQLLNLCTHSNATFHTSKEFMCLFYVFEKKKVNAKNKMKEK